MKKNSIKFIIEEGGVNFYTWRLIEEGFYEPVVKRYCGEYLKSDVIKIENDNGTWAPDINSWNIMGAEIIKKLENNKLHLDNLLQDHVKYGKRLYKLCDQIEKQNPSRLTNTHIKDWFMKAWKEYIDLSAVGFIPVISDLEHLYLTTKLTKILAGKNIKNEKIQDYLSTLSSLSRQNLSWKEKLKLLDICKKYKTINKIKNSKEFKRHISKYCWLNYGYQGPVWQESDFMQRINILFSEKTPVNKQYLEHKNSLNNLKKKQRRIEKELKLNPKEKQYFKSARMFMFMKSYRTEIRHRFYYVSDQIFKVLSKRFNIPLSELRYCLKEEIIKLLSNQKINYKDIISRKKLMVYAVDNQKPRFIPKNKIDEFLKKVSIEEKITKTDLISGQVAYPGFVKGAVKIVNSQKDVKKVNNGDVLVSICTNPDLLPAMIKAAAFVTDKGSITSHASIVSREMKKPCIIGTKVATKVLKDGDLVKVDAKKGIVKKI